jgi:hypothetical protein
MGHAVLGRTTPQIPDPPPMTLDACPYPHSVDSHTFHAGHVRTRVAMRGTAGPPATSPAATDNPRAATAPTHARARLRSCHAPNVAFDGAGGREARRQHRRDGGHGRGRRQVRRRHPQPLRVVVGVHHCVHRGVGAWEGGEHGTTAGHTSGVSRCPTFARAWHVVHTPHGPPGPGGGVVASPQGSNGLLSCPLDNAQRGSPVTGHVRHLASGGCREGGGVTQPRGSVPRPRSAGHQQVLPTQIPWDHTRDAASPPLHLLQVRLSVQCSADTRKTRARVLRGQAQKMIMMHKHALLTVGSGAVQKPGAHLHCQHIRLGCRGEIHHQDAGRRSGSGGAQGGRGERSNNPAHSALGPRRTAAPVCEFQHVPWPMGHSAVLFCGPY